jgi:hypothetical protein
MRRLLINLLLESHEEVVNKYRLQMAEKNWSSVSVLARDLSHKLTAHRFYCDKLAIDWKAIEAEQIPAAKDGKPTE